MGEMTTYYDRPVLKAPTWKWFIPAYFWSGGVAAGSSLLALGAMVTGDEDLARRARMVALPAIAAGSALLVADLGRPARFHHMLRVAKPSSPMSVGTWIVAGYGSVAGAAAVSDAFGIVPRVGRAATWAAALIAPAVASYPAVLLADTAVPAWHDARAWLPGVFVFSAAASAAGVGLVVGACSGAAPPPPCVRLAVVGALAETGAAVVMERRLEADVRSAYEHGPARALRRAAMGLNLGGAAIVAARRRNRWAAAIGGALLATGGACERFAVLEAGKASALDPLATTGPQRRRILARDHSIPVTP